MNPDTENLSIESLHFYAGKDKRKATEENTESDEEDGLVLRPTNLTIFVGPNNAGKSQTLREIDNHLVGNLIENKVLKDIEEKFPDSSEEFIELLKQFETPPIGQQEMNQVASGKRMVISRPKLSGSPDRSIIDLGSMAAWFDAIPRKGEAFLHLRREGLKFFTVFLDAQTRLALSKAQASGPLEESPKNHLWYLFENPIDELRVREECEAAFSGFFFTIDPTGMTQFRIRMSTEEPDNNIIKMLGPKGKEFYQKASLIDDMGDGLKCYVGMIAAVVALKCKFLFIDDPEAFLHPPVARQLGKSLAGLSKEYGIQLFISTHSSDLLLGCIEESQKCNVVRLTYSLGGYATATLLDNDILLEWLRKPILRSTNVLDGLFHSSVVVTEGDSDRVVYEEINRRLLIEERGVRDCEFLRAQNKDTIYKIVGPLNQIGVPVVGILDIDVLYSNSESEVKNSHIRKLLKATNADENTRRIISEKADQLMKTLRTSYISFEDFKENGLELDNLTDSIRSEIKDIIDALIEFGVFIVPNGALESWLKELDIAGRGGEWAANCFDRLGYDSESPTYIHPSDDDIWEFLDKIAEYIEGKVLVKE